MDSLNGKVVVITGASEGIGAQLAALLRQRGAKLALAARSESRLLDVQGRIEPKPGAETLISAGDLAEDSARTALIRRTMERWGRIDVLINNAGRGSYFSTLDTPLHEARALFELNFFAPLALAQLAAPHLRQSRGSLVNVSSIAGQIALPWLPIYSASKFALASITSTLRMELGRDGVHVMGVFPGYVNTAFQSHAAGQRPPEQVVKGKRFAISVEGCAEAIVHGLERRRRIVVTPRAGWPLIWLNRLFPSLVESQLADMKHGS
jgi:short-subunit dehydrogenase